MSGLPAVLRLRNVLSLRQVRGILLFTAVLLPSGAALHAQKANEVGLLIGGTFTPARPVSNDQAIKFNPSLSLGLEFDHRLVKVPGGSLSAGLDFAASPFDVITSSGPATAINEYAYLFLTPHLRFKTRPIAGFEPWGSIGVGYADYAEGHYRNGTANTRTGTSGPTGEFAAGVDYATPLKLFVPVVLRLEAKDFLAIPPSYNAPVPSSQNNVIVSGGFVLRF